MVGAWPMAIAEPTYGSQLLRWGSAVVVLVDDGDDGGDETPFMRVPSMVFVPTVGALRLWAAAPLLFVVLLFLLLPVMLLFLYSCRMDSTSNRCCFDTTLRACHIMAIAAATVMTA